MLPQGSAVVLAPGVEPRGRDVVARPRGRRPRRWTAPTSPSAIEAAAAHMRRLARTFVAVPAWLRTMELTGGRDSRLVLSLLLGGGHRPRARRTSRGGTRTCPTWWSHPPSPTASASTSAPPGATGGRPRCSGGPRLGARRRPAPVGLTAPTATAGAAPIVFADQIRHHVWLSSGALSTWDLSRSTRRPGSSLALSGLFGELLRTNYSRTNRMRTFDDLIAYHRAGDVPASIAPEVLRPDVRHHYAALVERELEELRTASEDPRDVVDALLPAGTGSAGGSGSVNENETRNRLFPLYSLPAIAGRVRGGPGAAARRGRPLEVMRACCDELARMPFAGKQWRARRPRRLPDAEALPRRTGAGALDSAAAHRSAAADPPPAGAAAPVRWWPRPRRGR